MFSRSQTRPFIGKMLWSHWTMNSNNCCKEAVPKEWCYQTFGAVTSWNSLCHHQFQMGDNKGMLASQIPPKASSMHFQVWHQQPLEMMHHVTQQHPAQLLPCWHWSDFTMAFWPAMAFHWNGHLLTAVHCHNSLPPNITEYLQGRPYTCGNASVDKIRSSLPRPIVLRVTHKL